MQVVAKEFAQNFGTAKGRRRLMELYGDSKTIFRGSNGDGEAVNVSFSHNGIEVTTYQDNGWLRIDYYDAQGNKESERFDGRWRRRNSSAMPATTVDRSVSQELEKAAESLNPNYGERHNDIVFAADVCRAVLETASFPAQIQEKLRASICTLDKIARR